MTKLAILKFSDSEFIPAIIENDNSIHCHSPTDTFYPSLAAVMIDLHNCDLTADDEIPHTLYSDRPYEISVILNTF